MTLAQFCGELGISRQTVYQQGTWRELRAAASLPPRARRDRPKWLTDLVADIPDPMELVDDDFSMTEAEREALSQPPEPLAHLSLNDLLRMAEPPTRPD